MSIPDAAPTKDAGVVTPPAHIAIIMDGNGRWAAARGLPRREGHRRGVEALRNIVKAAGELGIKYLTIYSFSAENWSRPQDEIEYLMGLLKRFVRNDLADLHRNDIRVRIIGERANLKPDIFALLNEAEELTKKNSGPTLVIAFNYGAQQEIAQAARRLAGQVARGELTPDQIDVAMLSANLQTRDIPNPDLIIRTSGEQRLSNFLLWQAAYSEFVFVETHWPDFDRAALEAAIEEFHKRDRRYGGLSAKTSG